MSNTNRAASKKSLAALCASTFRIEQSMLNAKRAGNLGEAASWKATLDQTHQDIETLAAKLGR